jgi:hypothetical protein
MVESFLHDSPNYDVLTPSSTSSNARSSFKILNIVLFAPAKECSNVDLRGQNGGVEMVRMINESGKMYVTGTVWKGRSAARLAVSNHLTNKDGSEIDWIIVKDVLEAIMKA